jgi:hypothetical protein
VWKGSREGETMVRYLLGELADPERNRLEEQYFQEDALHERLLAVEAELIDDYLRGDLTNDRKHRFESRYLTTPEGIKKVQFARSLAVSLGHLPHAHGAERIPWWHAVLMLFRNQSPSLRYAILMAVFLLLLSPILIMRIYRNKPNNQLAGETGGKGQHAKSPDKAAVATPKQPSIAVLALALVPMQRSGETGNDLEIPPGVFQIRLQLALQNDDYPSYRVILQTPGGKDLYQGDGLKAVTSAAAGKQVVLDLPARVPGPGDYILRLSGIRTDGAAEEVDAYAFRITTRTATQK